MTVSSATCTFVDHDFNRNGILDEDSSDTVEVSSPCSLDFTFEVPNTASQLGEVTCASDVLTYKAYCETAQFNLTDNGITGTVTIDPGTTPSMDVETVLGHLGCTGVPPGSCTLELGSLPTKTQGGGLVLDTGTRGCPLAFPAATVNVGGTDVGLQTNQLLQYSEFYSGGAGNCTTGTVIPQDQAARMCFGEADASMVTDCQQIGSGNNTSYHIVNQQNLEYLFTVSSGDLAQASISAGSCPHSGWADFTVFGQSDFDVGLIDGITPFDANDAPKARVVGATTPLALAASATNNTDEDGDGINDLVIRYHDCDLGAQTVSGFTRGQQVTVEISGNASTTSGDLPWHVFIVVDTN